MSILTLKQTDSEAWSIVCYNQCVSIDAVEEGLTLAVFEPALNFSRCHKWRRPGSKP